MIKQIVESENKNLYIRTLAQIEKNGKIKREVIYKLGNTYGNKELVYELVHETPVLRPQILQLSGLGEGVRFAIRGEKQLTFYEVDSDSQQEMKEIGAVPFNDADLWIYRAEMTEDKTKAYYLLGKGKYIFQKISLRIKVIVSICFSMVIMGILLLVLMLPQYAELMAKELEKRAKDVGYLAAKQIPLKNLNALDSISDYRNDDYMKVKHVIDNIFLSESGLNDLYCVLYTIRDDVITVNYSSEEDSGCIYPYDWIYEGSDEQQILATGTPRTYSQLGSFEGSYTFSLTPIMGENGKAEGLIEVGVNARQFKEDIEKTLKEVTVGIILAAAITIFLVVQLFKLKEYQEKKDE